MFGFHTIGILIFAAATSQVPDGDRPLPAKPVQVRAATPRKILTLREALDLAERNHPQLQVATDRLNQANAGIQTARAYLNPELSFGSLGHQRSIQPGTLPGWLHGFTFSQTFELPQLRRSRIAAAQLGRASSQYALDEDRLIIRGMVQQSFFEALRRKGEIQLAQENLRLLQELQRRIRVQYEVGEASRLELTRADTEVSVAAVQAQSAERRYSTALADLHAAIGAGMGRFGAGMNEKGRVDAG